MKLFSILIALACVALAVSLQGQSKAAPETPAKTAKAPAKIVLPTVKSADLNGKPFVLPDDFSAPRTLLLIAFEREHQDLIDGWVAGLKLSPEAADWFELPIVGEMSATHQKFLDGAMRGGIRGENQRARVVTLYADRAKFIAPLGQSATDTIYVVVAQPNGEVLALQTGKFDKAKAATIAKVWRAN